MEENKTLGIRKIHNFFKKNYLIFFYLAVILLTSYFTYFKNYDQPNSLFWDENYHIASAQKYLDGVMFMENHPPLGKLFIALGEKIFHPNDSSDLKYFTETDYIKEVPAGYSFRGVRFFPTLFGWLSVILFFWILYFISRNPHISFAFSFMYVFENSFIVHFRGAMLEGTQIFFILLAVLYFIYLCEKESTASLINYLVLGIFMGLAVSVKANSAIVFLLYPILFFYKQNRQSAGKKLLLLKKFFFDGFILFAGFVVIFVSVWIIHFSLGKNVVNNNFYRASEEYKNLIGKQFINPYDFFVILRDNFEYSQNYNKGVPKLDVNKPGENGSHPITWPLGGKPIDYRWDAQEDATKHLYLEGNVANWLLALLADIFSLGLVVAILFFKLKVKNKRIFKYIVCFLLLYLAYMATMLQIGRVMYLYHYFIPLIFSFILVFLDFYFIWIEYLQSNRKMLYISLLLLFYAVSASYFFISPLTYYYPVNKEELNRRLWQKKIKEIVPFVFEGRANP